MRRLASISQLGMVSLVYPGATHSRLEHSLGVYRNSLRLLARFGNESKFQNIVDESAVDAFVLAALLHDIGHWPFCHPIEDMRLQDLPEHETRVRQWINTSELANCIQTDWSCSIDDVCRLLEPQKNKTLEPATQFLSSCLSGPIDVDKLDYLQRDSLHAGVPYGRNFDADRLIGAMTIHPDAPRLAITDKGRTAAEMMVFARYVMFSEVYWHHAVRSATAMLQRAVFLLQHRIDLPTSLKLGDADWIMMLQRTAEGSVAEPLSCGIFGPRRKLYKRVAEFSFVDGPQVHQQLARRPYWWLVACAEELARELSSATDLAVHAVDVLIDAPPVKLEVDINMDVVQRDQSVRSLGEVSPVASALANQQFDDQVKKVRVFMSPAIATSMKSRFGSEDWAELLIQAAEKTEREIV